MAASTSMTKYRIEAMCGTCVESGGCPRPPRTCHRRHGPPTRRRGPAAVDGASERQADPEAALDRARDDERCGRHVVERDSEVHRDQPLGRGAASVLEPGRDLAEVGE